MPNSYNFFEALAAMTRLKSTSFSMSS